MNDKDTEARMAVEATRSSQVDPSQDSLVCPRCGRVVDSSNLPKLVLSSYADVYICSVCGFEEAMLGDIQPLSRWHTKSLQKYLDKQHDD